MSAAILCPSTVPLDSAPGGLAPDLVHSTVVRTSGGGEFAVGWVDDTPTTPTPGAERQKET